ncbi:serine/threonine-protein kinase [Mycolicibacterium holsaticum]|uniref:non-specific serine/threonine protein kinase n=1 Tax=Mycolicibacterium holsaticum TaxID=152142 RepID=A0A1E3R445_9MYCO|nr:serine/threonine-protein kinase [Mycolicibacterium holsaticum]ODQ84696.1 protein kinase [Mycolicibacterium holsaticum]
MLSPGDRFERYVVDAVLGHGGYATVYLVHDAATPQPAALKILDAGHRHQAQVARLRREFELAHRLDHPHIVRVFERGSGWLTMEVVDGGGVATLTETADRLAALSQIADALDYTHNRAVVHCDVKPANIRVGSDPDHLRAVLIDFGAAHSMTDDIGRRPTQAEVSLPYSAPELITGHAPTSATDEYALACTAVELITGAPPFTDDSSIGLIRAHLYRSPPRWSREFRWLPRVFDTIMAKAMAKEPTDRYQSCRELVSLLTRALH